MSPNELRCNNRVSTDEITSTLRRYKQCSNMTAVFHAVFDYANAPNKWGQGTNIDTGETFNMSDLCFETMLKLQ